MSKGITSKTRLLLGASTLLLTSTAGMAQVADVEIGGVVTLSGDAAQSQDQSNTKAVTATSTNANTTATSAATTGSSVTVDANRSGATALANTGTLSLGDTDSAATATSVALGTRQVNTGATLITVGATTTDSDVTLTIGATTGSTATLSNSTDAASATANSASQTVVLESTTLSLGTSNSRINSVANSGDPTDLDIDNGEIAVGSVQENVNAKTTATNTGSTMTLDAGIASGSALKLNTNTQDAAATGSTATNTIGLTGTTVGNGVAIASQQNSDATSAVTAATTASALLTADAIGTGSTATVSGNRIQARALTANTSNLLTVDATSVVLPAADADASAVLSGGEETVEGAFAAVNDQWVVNDTTATVDSETGASAIWLEVTGGVTGGSALVNDQNSITARAQAAVTANTTNLNIGGTLSGGSVVGRITNGAIVANVQSIDDGANVSSDIDGTSKELIATAVDVALTGSSISTSANRIQAFADGAVATNSLAVSATTIAAAAEITAVPVVSAVADQSTSTADTAFAVANMQKSGDALVSANIAAPATFSSLVTGLTDDSSVSLNGNVIDAFALSNKATNSVALAGTSVATDAGVLNVQASNAQVGSTIGSPFAISGAIATFTGDILDSAIAVNSNLTRGSAIGNVGNNTLAVSATTLSGSGTNVAAIASGDSIDGAVRAQGDYSLANSQSLGDESSSITDVSTVYGIFSEVADTISDSRLSVSSNTQFAEALGNSATNRIALTATGAGADTAVNPTAALSSIQEGDDAYIRPISRLTAASNTASDGSSIAINGNSNTALGVINNAVNSIAVSAITLDGAAVLPGNAVGSGTTTADYALNSSQNAAGAPVASAGGPIGGGVDSAALTTIINSEAYSGPTVGTTGSTVTLTGNMTTAEGSANRVTNQIAVSAIDNGATAALNNVQTSTAKVMSTASSNVLYAQETALAEVNADASSISIDGNSTMALARGNSANNALNYTVGATYSGLSGAAVNGTASAGATAIVLNAQTNSGGVTASTNSTQYLLALNSGTGAAALNSNATLANNTSNASAFGNVATSSLNMTTFGYGVPSSALASNQANQGAVTATAVNVSFGMSVGTTSGSALRVGGNNTTAQAVANSSVNSMNGGN